ncbi:MAG: HAD family hydrolase [Anaerolineales bacterium]
MLANNPAIVFDLDDTLRYNDPHAHGFFCDYAETLVDRLTLEQRRTSQRWEHTYWASSIDLQTDIETFQQGSDEFWLNYSKRHLQALGLPADTAQTHASSLHAHMRDNYEPKSRVRPETLQALRSLKEAGHSLGVITNRSKPIHTEMHDLGLDHYLDFYLTAAQLGAYKPRREIFDNLLKFISRSADEIIYVGDNYYADVLGARNAGIRPILLNWNGLYSDVDCEEIKSLAELPNILQLAPVQ